MLLTHLLLNVSTTDEYGSDLANKSGRIIEAGGQSFETHRMRSRRP